MTSNTNNNAVNEQTAKTEEVQPEMPSTIKNESNILSPESLDKKLKEKAKVRVTAYQATILMDGITTVLDEIDNLIIYNASKNNNELMYKLAKPYVAYSDQVVTSLQKRGFEVKVSSYDYHKQLTVSWPKPTVK